MHENRIRIFTGHFGSGKTEISLNYALKLAGENKKTCIADLDVVNPYFSVREVREFMESRGIRVIAPSIDITTAELSTVPPDVISAFDSNDCEVVLDVGGDDIGAVVLGQYNRYFKNEPYDMYFVINTKRPFTCDKPGIMEYIASIEKSSRLKVSYLVNNTNLSFETEVEDILKGHRIIEEVSKSTGIPVRYICMREDLVEKFPSGIIGEVFGLKIFMKPVWLE